MSPLVHSTHSTALRPIRSLTMYDTASLHVLSSRVSSTLSATSLYFDRPMDCRICEHRDDDMKQKQYRMQVFMAGKHSKNQSNDAMNQSNNSKGEAFQTGELIQPCSTINNPLVTKAKIRTVSTSLQPLSRCLTKAPKLGIERSNELRCDDDVRSPKLKSEVTFSCVK
jgi:hypothetical protein